MKPKKTVVKKLFATVVFAIIFAVLFQIATKSFIVIDNVDVANIDGFYQTKENSVDVMLMGASEIYMGYAPGLAWHEYGIKSMNLSIGGIPCSMYKSILKEIQKRQKPKLLIVNATSFYYGNWNLDNEIYLRKWIDNIPFSENREETIKDDVPEDLQNNMTFSLVKYHENWKDPVGVATSFFIRSHILLTGGGYLKGYYTKSSVTGGRENLAKLGYPTQEKLYMTDDCRKYLKEFLQYCKDSGVENMLMVAPPHQALAVSKNGLDEVKTTVEEYGYDFLDLHNDYARAGIDDKTDFADYEHLNIYGAQHFTSYLGQYMLDNYDVKSDTTDEEINEWDMCYDETKAVMEKSEKFIKEGIIDGVGEMDTSLPAKIYHRIDDFIKS